MKSKKESRKESTRKERNRKIKIEENHKSVKRRKNT